MVKVGREPVVTSGSTPNHRESHHTVAEAGNGPMVTQGMVPKHKE